MNQIDNQIESLKEQLAALERDRDLGYTATNGYDVEYYLTHDHVSLYDLEGNLLAVIADEATVRKYFHDKDSEKIG